MIFLTVLRLSEYLGKLQSCWGLRGEAGMKTPDALHVATAINQQCDIPHK